MHEMVSSVYFGGSGAVALGSSLPVCWTLFHDGSPKGMGCGIDGSGELCNVVITKQIRLLNFLFLDADFLM